jgi:hypothetical protein
MKNQNLIRAQSANKTVNKKFSDISDVTKREEMTLSN